MEVDMVATDRVKNNRSKHITINKDTHPPVIDIFVNGEKVIDTDIVYINDTDIVELVAVDEQSGVRQISYRIDNGNWITTEFPAFPKEVRIKLQL
ncbi:MAG: hypothetical protein QW416_07950 [Candidatus Nitrosocaldaceae archaeon]